MCEYDKSLHYQNKMTQHNQILFFFCCVENTHICFENMQTSVSYKYAISTSWKFMPWKFAHISACVTNKYKYFYSTENLKIMIFKIQATYFLTTCLSLLSKKHAHILPVKQDFVHLCACEMCLHSLKPWKYTHYLNTLFSYPGNITHVNVLKETISISNAFKMCTLSFQTVNNQIL